MENKIAVKFKLEKLVFKDSKEEFDYQKYLKLKGEYLHKQIYDILIENNDNVSYYELSSIIRYDKNLRDLLYKYLSLFEEELKAEICRELDLIDSNKRVFEKENLKKKIDFDKSLLYYQPLYLFELIKIVEFKSLKNKKEIEDLYTIKELRNKVMHHSFLILGTANNYKAAEKNLNNLSNDLNILCDYLPNDYQENFIKDINNLNYGKNKERFLTRLYLYMETDENDKNRICAKI